MNTEHIRKEKKNRLHTVQNANGIRFIPVAMVNSAKIHGFRLPSAKQKKSTLNMSSTRKTDDLPNEEKPQETFPHRTDLPWQVEARADEIEKLNGATFIVPGLNGLMKTMKNIVSLMPISDRDRNERSHRATDEGRDFRSGAELPQEDWQASIEGQHLITLENEEE